MNGMHGIIFSYEKKTGLRELIEHRIHGSIPFGGNYRVVDFMLSNMVNAGVRDVGVIMHGKCQSMLDHLGTGKSWDLSRNHGGLTLLPAFAYAERRGDAGRFRGKVEALGCVMDYLKDIRQDYVVLTDSDLPSADGYEWPVFGKQADLQRCAPPCRGRKATPIFSWIIPGALWTWPTTCSPLRASAA